MARRHLEGPGAELEGTPKIAGHARASFHEVPPGLGDADVSSAHFAVMTGHGLRGLASPSIRMSGGELDAQTVLDNALRRELYRRLNTFAFGAEAGANGARESLARFRIDLDTRDPKVLAAVEQFLHGDLRLAQSLAQRETSGIRSELDVTRAGRTVYGGLGFGAFGMSFFQAFVSQETDFAVQTPGGSLRGLARSFAHPSGAFFSKHGYGRTVLSGVESPAGGTADAQTSLYLSWRDEDGYMERDKVQAQSYDRYRAAGNLDGEVTWRHHGDAVRHFGEGIGWTIDGVMRLIDADAE